jgi:hypothetical protein
MQSFCPDLFTAQPCALLRSAARVAVDATAQIHQYDLIIGGENVPPRTGAMFETSAQQPMN